MSDAFFKQLFSDYERRAAADPRLLDSAVLCVRRAEVIPERQAAIFGPDWEKESFERPCAMCGETVICREVFKDCRMLICMQCSPGFVKAAECGAQA